MSPVPSDLLAFRAPAALQTDRLELRQFSPLDIPAYARFCADPEVMRYIGAGGAQPPDATWRSVAWMLGHWDLLGYGIWAVALRATGELVGRVGFIDPPEWPGFELGWLLGRDHWGRGYASEAAAAALAVARAHLRKQRIISLIRPANEASINLATRLGARREATVEFMGASTEVYVHGDAGTARTAARAQ